jgi:CheY-like chemotaxis protein
MKRKVLDVGQCNADNSRISQLLNQNFDVEISRAHSHAEAIQMSGESQFDLILINRLLDADSSPGMAILDELKANEATVDTPVMIVSNFAETQEQAVAAGAVSGFGKAALEEQSTLEILNKYLAD